MQHHNRFGALMVSVALLAGCAGDGGPDVAGLATTSPSAATPGGGWSAATTAPVGFDGHLPPQGTVVGEVLVTRPWIDNAPESSEPFVPSSAQDMHMVVASVASVLFGDRAAGSSFTRDTTVAMAVAPSDEEIDWLERELDSHRSTAAASVVVTTVPRSLPQLRAAKDQVHELLPTDVIDLVTITLEPEMGTVTVFAADDATAARVRNRLAGAPDWVTVNVDPDEIGVDA